MSKIFISYRRSDSRDFSGRLFDHLVKEFGRLSVFKDVDSLSVGQSFEKQLEAALETSAVVLVVIGPKWLEELHSRGDDPEQPDFVYREVVAALNRPELLTVPVLIAETPFPQKSSLPKRLRPLCSKEGHRIHHDPHFSADLNRLMNRLRAVCPALPTRVDNRTRPLPIIKVVKYSLLALVGLVLGLLMGLYERNNNIDKGETKGKKIVNINDLINIDIGTLTGQEIFVVMFWMALACGFAIWVATWVDWPSSESANQDRA